MARRFLLSLVGILMLPLCGAVTWTLLHLVQAIRPESDALLPPPALALLGGILLWQLLFLTLPKPVRVYVLGHELTHALWGMLMGARVLDLRVSKNSGSVTLSRSNLWITLAPYFFPFYTFLVLVAYYALAIFFDVERWYLVWLGLVGITWGFHLSFTVTTLMQKQSDIREYGFVFSYVIIYLMNVLGICLWVILVSPVTLEQGVTFLSEDTVRACTLAATRAMDGVRSAWEAARAGAGR